VNCRRDFIVSQMKYFVPRKNYLFLERQYFFPDGEFIISRRKYLIPWIKGITLLRRRFMNARSCTWSILKCWAAQITRPSWLSFIDVSDSGNGLVFLMKILFTPSKNQKNCLSKNTGHIIWILCPITFWE